MVAAPIQAYSVPVIQSQVLLQKQLNTIFADVQSRTGYIQSTATLPATALQQIQSTIDNFGGITIWNSGTPQQLVGTLSLGAGQVIDGRGYGSALQWLAGLGNNPAIVNKTPAPANLAAYDVGTAVRNIRLVGPWDGVSSATQDQHAVQWIACRDPFVDAWIEGFQGDGVYHGSKAGNYALYTYGARAKIRVKNLLRNGCTFTEGEGWDVDIACEIDTVTNRGCGLHVLDCEPNDPASLIRNGRFRVYSDGGGGGPLAGAGSYVAAFSDKNGGTCKDLEGSVMARNASASALYYRGVLGLNAKVSANNLAGHGIVGGNGAARASRVTFEADIDLKAASAWNGLIAMGVGDRINTTSFRVRQPSNVNPIALRDIGGGTFAGVEIDMTGAGAACIDLDHVSETEWISPRLTGGTYGMTIEDAHGASLHNKIRHGTFINQTTNALNETGTSNYTEVWGVSAEGAHTGVSLVGANSFQRV